MKLRRIIKAFRKDERGQFAVITAIIAVTLLMATSAAIDYTNAMSEHKSLKDALDNAVLAAATNNRITDGQRVAMAKYHFDQNYQGRAEITTDGTSANGRVDLWASGVLPFSVSDALGLKGIDLYAKSAAKRSEQDVICVLALAETERDSVVIDGSLEFIAPTCSVHANSTDSRAIYSKSRKTPIAKSFCATGGARGSFSPYAKGDCQPVEDPYFGVEEPVIEGCVSDSAFSKENKGLLGGTLGLVGDTLELVGSLIDDSLNLTGDSVTMYPGTYCGGLTVNGVDVEFMPGDYVMLDGPLTFKNGAEAIANDVTFAFSGKNARLKIKSGSNVYVKAPSEGARKGIAFMEIASTKEKEASKSKGKESPLVSNLVASGGKLDVLGTLYFPTQAIVVKGVGSQMGAQAPATSFIAHTIDLDGRSGSKVQIQVDHRSADLPPIQPRAEDGAILVE